MEGVDFYSEDCLQIQGFPEYCRARTPARMCVCVCGPFMYLSGCEFEEGHNETTAHHPFTPPPHSSPSNLSTPTCS